MYWWFCDKEPTIFAQEVFSTSEGTVEERLNNIIHKAADISEYVKKTYQLYVLERKYCSKLVMLEIVGETSVGACYKNNNCDRMVYSVADKICMLNEDGSIDAMLKEIDLSCVDKIFKVPIKEFDETMWLGMVDEVVVQPSGKVEFKF